MPAFLLFIAVKRAEKIIATKTVTGFFPLPNNTSANPHNPWKTDVLTSSLHYYVQTIALPDYSVLGPVPYHQVPSLPAPHPLNVKCILPSLTFHSEICRFCASHLFNGLMEIAEFPVGDTVSKVSTARLTSPPGSTAFAYLIVIGSPKLPSGHYISCINWILDIKSSTLIHHLYVMCNFFQFSKT